MGSKQNTLIYIEKDNVTEAEFMSRNFVDDGLRNRAYINALGAELVMKYLASCKIKVANIHNIHSISKILEKYDIADILLRNIHIDVRVVFDEKELFIPKTHYKLEITPDIYVFLKLDKNFEHVELLGFIEADKVNKKNANSEYYFVNKNHLIPSEKLELYIKDFTGTTSRNISEEDMYRGRELSIAIADHNTTKEEDKEFLELLLSSDALRESVLEFDNFETLAYNVASTMAAKAPEIEITPAPVDVEIEKADLEEETPEEAVTEEIAEVEQAVEVELSDEMLEDETSEEDILDVETEELFEQKDEQDLVESPDEELEEVQEEILEQETGLEEENLEEEITIEEFEPISEEMVEEFEAADLGTVSEEDNIEEILSTEEAQIEDTAPILDAEETVDLELPTEELIETDVEEQELTSDAVIEEALIEEVNETSDTIEPEDDITKGLAQTITDALKNSLEKGAAATVAAGTAGVVTASAAAQVQAAGIEASAAATDEVIKLAGVAGDVVSSVVEENAELQQRSLNRIDYEKTDIIPDVQEIPENIKELANFSASKFEANMEAEESGQYTEPLDLSELETVEEIHEEIPFEQDTIEIEEMETVENENAFFENTDEIVNIDNITSDSFTDNLEEINVDEGFDGIDFSDMSSYTINDDGTSNMDLIGQELDFAGDNEHLVDFDMNSISNVKIEDNPKTNVDARFDNNVNLFENEQAPLPVSDEVLDSEELTVEEMFSEEAEETSTTEQDDITEQFEEAETSELDLQEEMPIEEPLDETEIIEDIQNLDENEVPTEEDLSGEILDTEPNAEEEVSEQIEEVVTDELLDEEPANETETEQDWIEDTNYDNLEDVEIPENEIPQEEMIVEPDEENQKVYAVIENSTVISDKNYKVGEIPIDINEPQAPLYQTDDSIDGLYNDNSIAGDSMLQSPGRLGSASIAGGLGMPIKLAGGLIVLAIVCAIGFGVAKMFKAPSEETPQPITDDAIPTAPEPILSNDDKLNVNPDNVLNMDNATNALANPQTLKKSEQPTPVASAPAAGTQIGATSFLEVKKLTWEVPDYISYNPQFKNYFQAVGKSLKLALTSDLLLATDYPYSNEIRVSISFSKEGTFKTSQIFKSSGSTQIDNIVLQTVNQTLKALKAPRSVGNDETTTAILKIYF